jgi:hypothetical protein
MDRARAIRPCLSNQIHLDYEVTMPKTPDGTELAPSRILVSFSNGGTIGPGGRGRLRGYWA